MNENIMNLINIAREMIPMLDKLNEALEAVTDDNTIDCDARIAIDSFYHYFPESVLLEDIIEVAENARPNYDLDDDEE